MTRLAKDLKDTDLHTDITITGAGWSVTGTLVDIEHQVRQIDVSRVGEPEPSYISGRSWVDLTVGPWLGTVSPDAVVTDAGGSTTLPD